MAKSNLPSNYGDEAKKFRELYEKGSLRTTSGSGTYTSITSLITYTYTSGEQDLFTQLSTTLANYNIGQSDWDGVFVGSNIRGSITLTSPNLNVTPLKSGFYYCTSATNKPSGFGNGYLMHVQASTSDVYSTQVYFDEITGRVANRANNNSTWLPWTVSVAQNQALQTALDLNSFTSTNKFFCMNMTNAPMGSSGAFYIDVDGYTASTFATQTATGLDGAVSNRKWFRCKDNGIWRPWREILAETFGDVGGTDLNTFVTASEMYGSNFTNAPLSDTGYFYIKVRGYQDSTYAKQIATKLSGTSLGRKWERVKNAGVWESWTEIHRVVNGTSTLKTYLGVSSGEWHTPSGNADYPYYAYCTVVGATVLTTDKVNVSGASINDFALGASCGIADYTETGAGANTVTIWAQSLPTSNINILCEVVKG